LTDRDFAEHHLECQLPENKHAVYALTISVTKELYQDMVLDKEIGKWGIYHKGCVGWR
jgi:hypothetical protein